MSNLNQPQSEWNKIAKELGLQLALVKDLRDRERKFDQFRNRTQIHQEGNVNAFTSAWVLSGVVLGTSTDAKGNIYVRIAKDSPGGGTTTINLYSATGATGLIATGTVANTGGTCTLAAANGSGVTGTVTVANVTASETTDVHYLSIFQDWILRAKNVFDGSKPEHNGLLIAFGSMCAKVQSDLLGAIADVKAFINTWVVTRLANFTGSSSDPSPLSALPSTDAANNITILYTGTLEDTRKDMVDEGNAGAQTVQKNVIAAGAGVFDSGNQGLGVVLAPTVEQWILAGTITGVCTDQTFGSEKFQISQRLSSNPNRIITGKLPLQINKTFADPDIGIRNMTLTRTMTFVSGSVLYFGAIASWTILGENVNNTSNGLIYLKVVASGPNWIMNGYKDSSYTAASQVFTTAASAASTSPAIVAVNGSGMSGTAQIGSAPVDQAIATFNMNPFKRQNSSGVADKFTVAITVTSLGEFSDYLAQIFAYYFNGAASSPTLPDTFVSAGSFPPFEVRDA